MLRQKQKKSIITITLLLSGLSTLTFANSDQDCLEGLKADNECLPEADAKGLTPLESSEMSDATIDGMFVFDTETVNKINDNELLADGVVSAMDNELNTFLEQEFIDLPDDQINPPNVTLSKQLITIFGQRNTDRNYIGTDYVVTSTGTEKIIP